MKQSSSRSQRFKKKPQPTPQLQRGSWWNCESAPSYLLRLF